MAPRKRCENVRSVRCASVFWWPPGGRRRRRTCGPRPLAGHAPRRPLDGHGGVRRRTSCVRWMPLWSTTAIHHAAVSNCLLFRRIPLKNASVHRHAEHVCPSVLRTNQRSSRGHFWPFYSFLFIFPCITEWSLRILIFPQRPLSHLRSSPEFLRKKAMIVFQPFICVDFYIIYFHYHSRCQLHQWLRADLIDISCGFR